MKALLREPSKHKELLGAPKAILGGEPPKQVESQSHPGGNLQIKGSPKVNLEGISKAQALLGGTP